MTSPLATNPWGGIDLEDIQICVPSPLTDIQVMSPPATDLWGGIDLEDIQVHVPSPPLDIPALDMDLEDIRLDAYSADVAESCLEMDLNEVSLTVHVHDYSIQNTHPPRYLSSNFPAPMLKPPGLQHQWIWMKEARGMFLALCASAPSVLANHP